MRAMASEFRAYPEMKDSGVEWLGEVPAHWNLRRTKSLLVQRSEKGFPDEPLLAATQTKGVVRKEKYENRTVLAMKDLELLKIVRVGDFVISLRSFQGGIEFAREQGIISPAYTILFPFESDHHAYLAKVFKSRPYIENLSLFVTGIRQGQNIDYERLARSYLPLPPLPEQTAIVRFLHYADRCIQRYIRAKQKLLTLLEEQKQAIIHQAVTGQIDVRTGQPYPAYKDSGVEWLGYVPEHWNFASLKRLSRRWQNGATPPTSEVIFYENGTVPWYGPSSCGTKEEVARPVRHLSEAAFSDGVARLIQGPALLIVVIGATAGRMTLMSNDGSTNQQITAFEIPPDRVSPRFILRQVRGAESWLRSTASSATIPILDSGVVGRLLCAIPPLVEQEMINRAVNSGVARIDQFVERRRVEISLLREYRTRLIADVVTGKLDVREVAAELPENDVPGDAEEPAEKYPLEEEVVVERLEQLPK